MFSKSIRIIASPSFTRTAAPRLFTASAPVLNDKPLSQGHATRKPDQGLSAQGKAAQSGFEMSNNPSNSAGSPHDTASQNSGQAQFSQAKKDGRADASTENQAAQAGSFKDHRGSSQSTDNVSSGNKGESVEATPSSLGGAMKQAMGLGASKADHQENKTAPGAPKKFSTSARVGRPEGEGKKAEGDGMGARKPVDEGVKGDQNSHLKHKNAGEKDSGKGNAAAEPHLPSKSGSSASSARGFHTSARSLKQPTYAAATDTEPSKSGYDAPAEANPSANYYEKPPPVPTNLTPSSELPHSSSSAGPRHEEMAKRALDGNLAERNPPPSGAKEEQGLGEGWKIRNAEQKLQK